MLFLSIALGIFLGGYGLLLFIGHLNTQRCKRNQIEIVENRIKGYKRLITPERSAEFKKELEFRIWIQEVILQNINGWNHLYEIEEQVAEEIKRVREAAANPS